jgi:sterol 3beta-glucosyltransferase
MFSDAALYEKVLSACPETLKSGCFFNADDQATPNCLGGFSQLIGRDLGDVERAVTGKLASLSVNNWVSSEDDPFGANALPEEERGEGSSSDESEDKEQALPSAPSEATLQEEPPSEPKLTPEEIVDLLEQEFGALAPLGEEKLLLETDAAFFKEVIVLVGHLLYLLSTSLHSPATVQGVVHLTTHRFTFHASLLTSQPGDSQKVVRSGSAMVHRKGWRRKRKVWLQMDHDMISSFPSSRDEDKIKPLRSMLCAHLSSTIVVLPIDSVFQYPRSGKSSPSIGNDPDLSISSSSPNMASTRQLSSLIPLRRHGTGEMTSKVCVSSLPF